MYHLEYLFVPQEGSELPGGGKQTWILILSVSNGAHSFSHGGCLIFDGRNKEMIQNFRVSSAREKQSQVDSNFCHFRLSEICQHLGPHF